MRQAQVELKNNFSSGLITEVTGLNSPENSVIETDNCVYHETGEISRRNGIDKEKDGNLIPYNTLTSDDGFCKEFLWDNIGADGDISFLACQFAEIVSFFNLPGTDNPISKKSFYVDLRSYKVSGVTDDEVRQQSCSFASGFGKLFISHPLCNTVAVNYDIDTDSISLIEVVIKIRDFEGLEDNLEVDERPTLLTREHRYNLHNQGWYDSGTSKIYTWDFNRSDFPSNADIWYLFKNSSDVLDMAEVPKIDVGNTKAPKGHFILEAFNQDRTNVSGISLLDVVSTTARPSVNAFYAGRVFYSGVKDKRFSFKVYFSSIIENDNEYGLCYQKNDPTSEDYYDLLDSDGGVISIPEINEIIDLRVVGDILLVFATNGIWSISGSTDGGSFKATDYIISKISNTPCISAFNIVETEGPIFWWNYDGIYVLQSAEGQGTLIAQSASKNTIQKFYDEISNLSIKYAKGSYNPLTKIIHWIYHDNNDNDDVEEGLFNYTKVICFNAITGAFYTYTFQRNVVQSWPKILGIFIGNNYEDLQPTRSFKYITKNGSNLQFSNLKPNIYTDWKSFDGVGLEYESYFITGYMLRSSMLTSFQNHYVTVYYKSEYNSACNLQGIWDYSYSSDSNKETTKQRIYRRKDYHDYLYTKLRIRGSGRSLQFKFTSEEDKPFYIVGWASFTSQEETP